jgi:hypothetical protein
MAGTQSLTAIAMAFLLAGLPGSGRPDMLGIVVRANHANLGSYAVIQVRVLGEKELIIFARRGPAQFSYRDESVTIDKGKSYRVVLDPSQDGAAASQDKKKAGGHNKTFVLIAVGAAAGVAGVVLWRATATKAVESPDHP